MNQILEAFGANSLERMDGAYYVIGYAREGWERTIVYNSTLLGLLKELPNLDHSMMCLFVGQVGSELNEDEQSLVNFAMDRIMGLPIYDYIADNRKLDGTDLYAMVAKTATGRLSTSAPNVQNLPVRKLEKNAVFIFRYGTSGSKLGDYGIERRMTQ